MSEAITSAMLRLQSLFSRLDEERPFAMTPVATVLSRMCTKRVWYLRVLLALCLRCVK